jgi:Putative binding domain, N-terminal/Viral BACON domain
MAAAGGQFDVAVATAAGCTWSATSSAQFISTVGAASGTGAGSVRFNVAANSGASRQGAVQVANRALTISQAASGSACEFTVDPTQASLDASGGTVSVTVTRTLGSCGWTATSNDAFITVESGASGTGNGTTVLRVAASNVGTPRTGTVTVAGRVVTITQAPAAEVCVFAVSPTTIPMGAAGGTAQVNVTVAVGSINCRWTAQSNSNFLTINATSAVGPGSPTITVAANAGGSRSGTLTIGGQTVTVNQAGAGGSTNALAILSYQSEPGDFIGGGLSNTYTLTGSQFTVTLDASQSFLHFNMPGSGGTWWDLRLKSASGPLTAGTYNLAERWPFASPGAPMLDFSGSGRGCNQLTGRFLIQTATFVGTDVQRLHVRFEQHCEGWSTPLRGQLWIDAGGSQPPALANFPAPPATPFTQVTYTSDAGDPIGRGQSGSFTLSGFKFRAWALPSVNITMQTASNIPTTFWHFDFSSGSGTRLQPGTYSGAIRYPFNSGVPGLSIGNGTGCNTLTGSFVVLEAVYGAQGDIQRFHATFEQHCEGAVPALRGEVRIIADPWR